MYIKRIIAIIYINNFLWIFSQNGIFRIIFWLNEWTTPARRMTESKGKYDGNVRKSVLYLNAWWKNPIFFHQKNFFLQIYPNFYWKWPFYFFTMPWCGKWNFLLFISPQKSSWIFSDFSHNQKKSYIDLKKCLYFFLFFINCYTIFFGKLPIKKFLGMENQWKLVFLTNSIYGISYKNFNLNRLH